MDTYQEDFKKAGVYARDILKSGIKQIKKGASYKHIIMSLYEQMKQHNVQPAFPPQMAFDTTAAHFMIAPQQDIELDNQLIKLDVGVKYNGAIGDNAATVDLSGQWSDLVKASRDALDNAIKVMDVGVSLHELGTTINQTIQSYDGLTPITNLSGHGLGHNIIHAPPSIPNYGNADSTTLTPNMTFACEPFATNGTGKIKESDQQGWIFRKKQSTPVRDPIARTILSLADQFEGCPFSLFELPQLEQYPAFRVSVALKQLQRSGALESYPALIEVGDGMVSQAEHSILIDDQGKKWVTTQ